MTFGRGRTFTILLVAFLTAARLLFPLQRPGRYGYETDLVTTLLHVAGIVAVGAGIFFVLPYVSVRRAKDVMRWAILGILWAVYIPSVVVACKTYGCGYAIEAINLPLTSLGFVIAIWLLWLTFRTFRRSRPLDRLSGH